MAGLVAGSLKMQNAFARDDLAAADLWADETNTTKLRSLRRYYRCSAARVHEWWLNFIASVWISLSLTHNTRASRLAAAERNAVGAQNNQLSYGPPRVFYYVVLFFSSVGCAAAHSRSAGGRLQTARRSPTRSRSAHLASVIDERSSRACESVRRVPVYCVP